MKKIFVRSAFNYDADSASLESGLTCEDESLTRQSEAGDADINTIVRRFGVTGQLPVVPMPPAIDEFADVFDFQSALEVMARARASFALLPAEVRSRFENDPGRFVGFVDGAIEAGDLEELRKMGLAVPAVAEEEADVKPAVV